jgi:excisionase family DNA binding protein
MSATEERLLSLEDVADRLQVSDQSVRRWIKAGKLAAYKPGLEWRIRPSDLEDFLETRSYPKVQAPLPSGDPQAGRRYSPTDQEIKSLVRWLSFLEHRLNDGNLTREEIAHDLDAASAFGIRKDPALYPDEVFDKFMRLSADRTRRSRSRHAPIGGSVRRGKGSADVRKGPRHHATAPTQQPPTTQRRM